MSLRKNPKLCLCLGLAVAMSPIAQAQEPCCFEPAYRLQCQTVMQPQTVQRFRVAYDTEYVNEEVTSYRPVVKTRIEEREVSEARPYVETSFREEHYTVWKPIVETSYRDETVTKTSYVTETSEREEQYTTYKPVVETQYYEQQYTVQRPITETQYYQQQYAVQRPVVETQMQTQTYTSMRPVTTMQTQTIDAGGYVAQQFVTPGQLQYGLGWNRNAYAVPGPLGLYARVRGAPVVTPYMTPATVQTQYAYRPNYIQQQVAQTSYVPQTQQVQVPVQVQRMQTEMVTQNVPVQVQKMQSEVVTQKVPVRTTRMVPITQVRKVPYVVQRPVTETVTRQVPIQNRKWVKEVKVRKVPIRTTKMRYETRKVPVEVRYTEMEAYTHTVRRPVTRKTYIPENVTIMSPRQVVQRTPLSYYDPFSPAIVSGYSSFAPPIEGSEIISQPHTGESILADPLPSDGGSVTNMKAVISDPENEEKEGQEPASSGDLELNSPDAEDVQDLPEPAIDPNKVREAGWKIRWNPSYARHI